MNYLRAPWRVDGPNYANLYTVYDVDGNPVAGPTIKEKAELIAKAPVFVPVREERSETSDLDPDHEHVFTLEHLTLIRTNEPADWLTAFIYKCTCGMEAKELAEAGIEMLKNGWDYEVVIGDKGPGYRI